MSAIERLDWDSAFFGFPIGKVSGEIAATELEAVTREADEASLRCVYLLAPANDHSLLDTAQRCGFRVRDVRMQFEREVSGHRSGMAGLRQGSLRDLSGLIPIARDRFRGTRFFADRGFPADRSAELYVEWLTQGLRCQGDRTSLVADNASGFVTCRLDHVLGIGQIELIAVAAAVAGGGVGGALLAGVGTIFADHSLATARVATQGNNVAAQRLYQAHGYRTTSVDLWLHRWRE